MLPRLFLFLLATSTISFLTTVPSPALAEQLESLHPPSQSTSDKNIVIADGTIEIVPYNSLSIQQEELFSGDKKRKRALDVNGNGVTYPGATSVLNTGAYVVKFSTAAPWNWSTVSVDLYSVSGGQKRVTTLNYVDYTVAVDPIDLVSGAIPIVLSTTYGTGPVFIIRISSQDRFSNNIIQLPDSSIFSIVDPTVEISAPGLEQTYVALDNVPIGMSALLPYSIIPFVIPTSLKLGQNYYLRWVPLDGPGSSKMTLPSGDPYPVLSLPSSGFTIFESAVLTISQLNISLAQESTTTSTKPISIMTGTPVLIKWYWTGTVPVSTWYLDIYSAGPGSSKFMGVRITSVLGSGFGLNTFNWIVDPGLDHGPYYFRVYGWQNGVSVGDGNTDPFSAMSRIFVVTNPAVEPTFSMQVYVAQPWSISCYSNITWKVLNTGYNVNVQNWTIDLYQNSLPYKFKETLTPTPLPANTTWAIVKIPDDLTSRNDYFIRVTPLLNYPYQTQNMGYQTSQFPIQPAPPVDQRNKTIANFVNDPFTGQALAAANNNGGGGSTTTTTVKAGQSQTTVTAGLNQARTTTVMPGNGAVGRVKAGNGVGVSLGVGLLCWGLVSWLI
ncbi:hypothetical protein HDU76_012745 [Blyttiomyces sp. JEL0837]|nr:hypothetical protein HDU76_012745 [Blyttiomyces sp. JEL0837]